MNDTVAATGLSSEGCFITTSGDDTVESGSEVVPCEGQWWCDGWRPTKSVAIDFSNCVRSEGSPVITAGDDCPKTTSDDCSVGFGRSR